MSNVYDASLYSEAQSLNKRAGKVVEATTNSLIDSLAFARDAVRRVDEEHSHLTEEILTEEIKAKLAPIDADRKALKLVFTGAAEKFEARLMDIFKRDKKLPEETDNGVRLTVALLPRISLAKGLDWLKKPLKVAGGEIPVEYLLPLDKCIDWQAVKAARAKDIALPWTEEFDQISLRPKLPEV